MQIYYFGKCKCTIHTDHDVRLPETFREEQPYTYEINVSVSKESGIPACGQGISYDKHSCIAKCEGGWLLYPYSDRKMIKNALWIAGDYQKIISYGEWGGHKVYGEKAIDYMRVFFDAVLPINGGSIIHSSCVKYKERCLLFCGPSGVGKSTHAGQWEKRFQAPMLSSDAPAVFVEADGAEAYGMPWDGSDNIKIQEHCPIAAIVFLNQGRQNRIAGISQAAAFRMLLKQGHMPMWDQKAMIREIYVLKKLSAAVPCFCLDCLPDTAAAELVERTVFRNNIG